MQSALVQREQCVFCRQEELGLALVLGVGLSSAGWGGFTRGEALYRGRISEILQDLDAPPRTLHFVLETRGGQ